MGENLSDGEQLDKPADNQLQQEDSVENLRSTVPPVFQPDAQNAPINGDSPHGLQHCEEPLDDDEARVLVNDVQDTEESEYDHGQHNTIAQGGDGSHALLAAGALDLKTMGNLGQEDAPFPDFAQYQELMLTGETTQAYPLTEEGDNLVGDAPHLEGAASIVESEAPRIQAFAKLEFDDGEFYMNTYSVELGRDIRAARLAHERDQEVNQQPESLRRKPSASSADAPQTPKRSRQEETRHLASSVVSESGGIIGVDPVDSEPRSRKGKKSKSTTSSSQYLSRKSSINLPAQRTDYQSLAMASLMDPALGIFCMDPRSPLPLPDACPLVPIHPPAMTEGHKSISRKHVKIAFNFEKHLFEVVILGRNGAFVDEDWYPEGDIQPLRNGSLIQIGGVGIRFLLPDVALGETGAESTVKADPASGGKMSFDFEDGRGERHNMIDSSEIGSIEGNGTSQNDDDNDDEDSQGSGEEDEVEEILTREEAEERLNKESAEDEEEEGDDDEPEVVRKPVKKSVRKPSKKTIKKIVKRPPKKPAKKRVITPPTPPTPEPVLPPPKRKGPGRPPKNGIASKREQALLARQAREEAKAAALKDMATQPARGKGNNDKSPKTEKQEDPPMQPNGKRKYKKRRSKADGLPLEQQGTRESTEHTESVPPEQVLPAGLPPKPPKEKKPPKPPRSPSPVYDESTMTTEQLAKPQSSYVILIHEALSNSKTGAMSLPQIYRAIERRYPFYKLRVQTTGWQSSVRHNLSQHAAFRKIERDGKGWMWGLVPEVSIEKEKKRRPSPPQMPQQQHYYPPGPPQMMQHPYRYPGMHPPHGHIPGQAAYPPYGTYPGISPGYRPSPSHVLPPPLGPHGFPLPLVNAQVDTSSTYQSPYQSAPPAQLPPPPPPPPLQANTNPLPNGANGTYQNSTSLPIPLAAHTSLPRQSANLSPTHTPYFQQPQPQQPSQQTHQPPQPKSQPPPPPYQFPRPPNSIGQDVLQAVGKFKNVLISSMPDKDRAELLVTSAINRTLGIQAASSATPGQDEDPQEKAIMQALTGMLGDLHKKNNEAQRQASNPPPMPPATGQQGQQQGGLHNHSTRPQQQQPPSPSASIQQGAQAQAQLLQIIQKVSRRTSASVPTSTPPPQEQPPTFQPSTANPSTAPTPPVSDSIPVIIPETRTETDAVLPPKSYTPVPAIGVKRSLENDTDGALDAGQPEAKRLAAG